MSDLFSDPQFLKQQFPAEQFAMECFIVEAELQESRQLQAKVLVKTKRAKELITMNDGYVLQIEPSGIGFGGYPTWFHQTRVRDMASRESKEAQEVQAKITLIHVGDSVETPTLITSFSDRGLGMEHLLRRALAKIETYCNTRLVPLPVVRIENN